MKNNKPKNDLDILAPLAEMLQGHYCHVCKAHVRDFKVFWKKITNQTPPIAKIERERLRVKKKTDNPLALGIDTKNKKVLMLSEIDFRRHSF